MGMRHIRLRSPEPIELGQTIVLVLLGMLTVGSWAVSMQQARSMDMPMGVAIPGIMSPASSGKTTSDMDSMPGMTTMSPADPEPMQEMAGTGMGSMGWTLEGLLVFLLAWSVMMAAMMFPAAAPMILFFQKVVVRRNTEKAAMLPTWVFVAGYLIVWAGVGIAAWMAIRLISDLGAHIDEARRQAWAPLFLGAVLVAAGLYQFTPLKRACLRQCQSPLDFVIRHWRDGQRGALRMGVLHGMYCLGCCWMLFAVLVAAGVMSMAWMLLLTLVIFMEKVLVSGMRAARVTGVALVALGLLVAGQVTALPWSA